jgi:hypothetical protein
MPMDAKVEAVATGAEGVVPGDPSPFVAKQYDALREEIMKHVDETRRLELAAIGGVAALFAWFATRAQGTPPYPVWLIGSLIPLLGAVRSVALFRRVQVIAQYIREELEPVLLSRPGDPRGWETYFEAHVGRGKPGPEAGSRVSFTSMLFWLVLLGLSAIVPLAFT